MIIWDFVLIKNLYIVMLMHIWEFDIQKKMYVNMRK